MQISKPSQSWDRHARTAAALEVFLGVGALAGGLALMAGPHGEVIPLRISSLAGSPFDSYFVPGLVLFSVLGMGPLGAAALIWARHPLAPLATLVVGIGLLIWLVVEIAIIGYSSDPPLQPFYLMLGLGITLIGLNWLWRSGDPGIGDPGNQHRTTGSHERHEPIGLPDGKNTKERTS